MADERLTSLYKHIDISEIELKRSREKLVLSLEQGIAAKSPDQNSSDQNSRKSASGSNNRFPWLKPKLWAPLAAAASILAIAISVSLPQGLNGKHLADIENFVAKHGDHQQLFARANSMKASNSQIERLNALALITMLGTDSDNQLASAKGLVEDPRPEFRAYYLEYLLDYADEAIYNVDYIEGLIDKEDDEECLYLLGRLLKLALSNQDQYLSHTTKEA